MQQEYDIAIVGGGLAGASLACCLGKRLRVAIIEAVPARSENQPSYDDRGLALSLSSQRILAGMDVWSHLAGNAVPIRHIHVSDRGRFGFVRFHAAELNLPAMGYVVIARELGRVLLEKIAALDSVDFICPASVKELVIGSERIDLHLHGNDGRGSISCRLLVAADGMNSTIRDRAGIRVITKDYGQTAIVANVTVARGLDNTAFERFTSTGPLALLPLSDRRYVSVFTVDSGMTTDFMRMDDAAYLQVLEETFGRRLGKFLKIGNRKSYPLALLRAERQFRERIVLLGNSAHTIHPNGAQGFNLGLRDVAALAENLLGAAAQGQDPGSADLLEKYHASRQHDQQRVINFTDHIAGLFYNDDPVRAAVRNTGMLVLDLIPPLKRRFMREAMGLHGRQPSMVRGLYPGLS